MWEWGVFDYINGIGRNENTIFLTGCCCIDQVMNRTDTRVEQMRIIEDVQFTLKKKW